VKLWDTRSWKVVATLRGAHLPPSPLKTSVWIGQIAFSPDGKRLATVEIVYSGGEMNPPGDFVQLWDTTTWKVQRSLHQPIASEIQVAFAPDSRQLAVAGGWINRGDVLLWNIGSGKTRPLISLDDVDTVSSIVYDPHGRWVAFATQAGARFVDVASAKQFRVVQAGGSAFGPKQVYAVSPDGRLLAAIREDGAVEIWRLPADLGTANAAARRNAPAAAPAAGAAPQEFR
jgi:WD40 repeat protein